MSVYTTPTSPTRRKCFAVALSLFVDFMLFHWVESRLQRNNASGELLLHRWVSAALRCLALIAVCLLILGGSLSRGPRLGPLLNNPAFIRYIAAHTLLSPVYETGRTLLCKYNAEEESDGADGPQLSSPSSWLLCCGASAAAALFWEISIPDRRDGGENGEEKKQKSRVLFVRVLRLLKPDYLLLLGAFLFLSLAVLCEMFIPFYTGRVIDILGGQYQSSEFMSAILFMGLYALGSSLGAGCRGGLFVHAGNSFTCRMKVKLFGALVKQEMGFFEAVKTGDLTSRLSEDTKKMGTLVTLNPNVLLRTLIKTVGMISLMMSLSWKLTFLVLMETPITGLIQNIYDTHYQRLSLAVQDSVARANEAAIEAVSAIRVVRSFSMERGEAQRYDGRLMDTHSLKTRRDTVRAVYLLARRLTGLVMQVAVLYYGRLFIQRGQMTTGNLVSFIMYQEHLGRNIRTVIYMFGNTLNSVSAAGKVFEYLDREPRVSTVGSLAPDHLQGHVSFQRLTFSYPSQLERVVLQDFSLDLIPGKMTALVGASGEGKTTCVSLLERFYEPQKGEILLDGQPLHSYEHSYLHRKIVLVSQEPVLFSGSVRDNIAYGLPNCSLGEVQEAARRANAHDFISQLEKGYDTEVGEGGGHLSKSEKQRLAIARALVRHPQVLILDEITSSLDSDSETKVKEALSCNPDQTLLVIAHRLKTIERADQIVVIGEGRVQEQGTHEELMEMKSMYYRLKEKLFTEGDTLQ